MNAVPTAGSAGTAPTTEGADTPLARLQRTVRAAEGPDPSFGPAEAVAATQPEDIAHFLHPHFAVRGDLDLLATGVPASPGAASGRVVTTADDAVASADRGEAVILVRRETSPEDVLGMQAACGILTARGGLASHAAVVARGWGIPAVVGLGSLLVEAGSVVIDGRPIAVGDVISIDGHTGQVFAGASAVSRAGPPPEMDVLLGWADALRAGHFAVRANADDGSAAAHARVLGADGIGLCRTEHMFLAADRLPLIRTLILSDDPAVDQAALHALEDAQQQDFEELLRAMDGLPVTVRLLDPPLHEFLPDLEPLVVAEALGDLDDDQRQQLGAVRRLHETNPMIGTRGVRLGMVKPGLYPMQVRAVGRAVAALQAEGLDPRVEIMIPLVVDAAELRLARRWVEDAEEELDQLVADRSALSVGTMIETPRAALVAGELAEVADFFSFGTNDLTQLTFAFSRDDVESELLPRYLNEGMLAHNPFEVLDQDGVGLLIRYAVDAARVVDPTIKIGACGEQAGDPDSAAFLVASGLDYVSCSPFRLPVVRLAVAQALLRMGLANAIDGVNPVGTDAEPFAAARVGPDGEFALRHALRVRAFASAGDLADSTGLPLPWVTEQLDSWREAGVTRFHEARGFWQLTPTGRELHQCSLPGCAGEVRDRLLAAYPRFLEVNGEFKELCSTWQLRGTSPNDHTDADYDRARVEDLARLDGRARRIVAEMAAADHRFGRYGVRLATALERVSAGDRNAFTGVMKRSYHDIWMELHEDLICVLGIDRAAEGST